MTMSDQPEDLERRRLQHRRVQLRNHIFDISGGEAQFGAGQDVSDMSLAEEVTFLENIVAYETAPRTTWIGKLRSAGYDMPDPATLSDEEIGLEVWQVIQRISELSGFFSHTNHFSDRELYEHLYHETLRAETLDLPPDPDSASHIDLIGSGSDEHIKCWLRFYADKQERAEWKEQFPDNVVPPAKKPPYDRDQLLPRRETTQDANQLWEFFDGLLMADWESGTGPIQLAKDLPEPEVAPAPFYIAARALLETLRDGGPAKATATLGNLPRSLVNEVFPRLPYDDAERKYHLQFNKVFNEEDLSLLHAVRITGEAAKLLRKTKGRFAITKRGRDLLDPAKSGELYRTLFITFFRSINLAYFDRVPNLIELQQTLAIILWRLGIVARDWTSLVVLAEETLLPEVLELVADQEKGPHATQGFTLYCRIWRYLDDFGLLEPDQKILSAARTPSESPPSSTASSRSACKSHSPKAKSPSRTSSRSCYPVKKSVALR